MRDWARRELNGYAGADTVPDYRHVPAALMARITNSAGYNGRSVRFDDSVLPTQIRDIIREKIDLEDAILGKGIGELEAMASQGTDEHTLIPSWATFIAGTLNQHNMGRIAASPRCTGPCPTCRSGAFSFVSAPPWPNWSPSRSR